VASGQQASVIVMSIDTALQRPGLLSVWVGRIRGQLRGGDRAGMLSDREIAVLLCGASADQAAVVSTRLKRMLESDESARASVHTTIGVTTRVPDLPFEGSLVGAARASATGG
jgi:GGDEF domain-containing protein